MGREGDEILQRFPETMVSQFYFLGLPSPCSATSQLTNSSETLGVEQNLQIPLPSAGPPCNLERVAFHDGSLPPSLCRPGNSSQRPSSFLLLMLHCPGTSRDICSPFPGAALDVLKDHWDSPE